MNYIKDTHSGKVYAESSLATVIAVDPNHFDTDLQNLRSEVISLQAQIDDINNNQIPTKQAEKDDFFNQFPELVV